LAIGYWLLAIGYWLLLAAMAMAMAMALALCLNSQHVWSAPSLAIAANRLIA
jgi:hypothetical protein